jgi:3-oxoacyl-[acyl-carrier-protein] synthase-3
MGVCILGTGSALPDRILSNRDLELMVETSDEWILSRTGIRERRIAGPEMSTSELAFEAARRALDNAGITAAEIDLIIVATVTPDMVFPSTACLVQDRLGAHQAAAFDLSAACSGFLYGLVTAEHFLSAGECRQVLVIGADILSRLVDFTDRQTCIIFGDGAGAVVLGRRSGDCGIISTYLGADGSGGPMLYAPAIGSPRTVPEETVPGGQFIKMQGQEVFKFAVKNIPECTARVLERAGMQLDQVDHVVLHQANLRILKTVAKKMGIPWGKMIVNIERYGNISAASIPLVLDEAAAEKRISAGDIVLMVGFGAGLTMGSALLRWGCEN